MKEKEKRTKLLRVYLNQGEYEKAMRLFNATTCRSLSSFARRKVLDRPLVGTFRNASLDGLLEELAEIKTELSVAGSNFSLAVKKLHTLSTVKEFEHWLISYELDKRTLLRQVEKISEQISKASDKW